MPSSDATDRIRMEAVFFYIAYNQEPGKIEMRVHVQVVQDALRGRVDTDTS